MPTTKHTPRIQNHIQIQVPREGLQKTKLSVPVYFNQDSFQFIKNKKEEVINSHKLDTEIWHLDMPKVILKRFWLQLHSRRNTILVNKTPTDNGGYYWQILDFKIEYSEQGKKKIFTARKILPVKSTIKEIEQLYQKLVSIEKTMGVEVAEKFVKQFLKEREQSLQEFIKESCLLEVQDIINYHS